MIQEIRDELFRIGKKVNRKQLFELCPIYLFTYDGKNDRHIQNILNDLRYDLADTNLFASKSNVLLYYHLSYDSTDSELRLLDESGNYKNSLDRWLSCIGVKYHFDCGIILINIDKKETVRDNLWWRQFFLDVHKYISKFLFFISSSSSFSTFIYSMFEKEFFTMMYKVDDFTIEDYFDMLIVQIEEHSITLDETTKIELKKMLAKYENDINHHVLELWLNSLLWKYYSNREIGTPFSLDFISEKMLCQIIERFREDHSVKIGF